LKGKTLKILDCTLRDGGYSLDFQFTVEDTVLVAAGLEEAGIPLIEVGHGLGLNASRRGYIHAAAEDEDYLKGVASVLKSSKFGMFFIPGIGREKDLKMAAGYGMNFVRVGTNITETERASKYISYAKELGLTVSANLMKSYALPIKEFLKKAKLPAKYGADIICVVDSAGGMLKDEVRDYIETLRQETSCEIGFHSHANFQLAISNSIEAIEAGATVIDSSLQGLGRSAGNAQTEVLVMLLEKMGIDLGIDKFKLLDLGEKVIKPLMREKFGVDSISAVCGYALFHSGFLPIIYDVAKKHNLDPKKLILEVSKIDKVHINKQVAEKAAQRLKSEIKRKDIGRIGDIKLDFLEEKIKKRQNIAKQVKEIAKEMFILSQKTGKRTAFTIAKPYGYKRKSVTFPFIRQNAYLIIGNVEVSNIRQAEVIAKEVDGLVDYVFVDKENIKPFYFDLEKVLKKIIKKSRFLTYRDGTALVNAVDALIFQLNAKFSKEKILILGLNELSIRLALNMSDRGSTIFMWDSNFEAVKEVASALNKLTSTKGKKRIYSISDPHLAISKVGVLIGMQSGLQLITRELVNKLRRKAVVIDAGIGTLHPEAIELGNRKGIQIYRIDMRAGLSGEITTVMETDELLQNILGRDRYNDVPVVAGGLIGKKGDIIIDSISHPEKILGIADGQGGFLKVGNFKDRLRKAKLEIVKRKYR